MLKVIVREFDNGELIALFPEQPGDNRPLHTCLSYMTVGQHGAASVDIVKNTKPAKNPSKMLWELDAIGYKNLRTAKRFSFKDYKKRAFAVNTTC